MDANAVHVAYGSSEESETLTLPQLKAALGTPRANGRSYNEIVKIFNDMNKACSDVFWDAVKAFYIETKDLIYGCLKDEYKAAWNATKDLIWQDINNKGQRYFCVFDWSSRHPQNFNASDNFFNPETKDYRIHDGIIGFIKSYISTKFSEDGLFHTHNDIWSRDMLVAENDPELETSELVRNIYKIQVARNKMDHRIEDGIKEMFFNEWGVRTNRMTKLCPICQPAMGCRGKFAEDETHFMKNPDMEEDAWLTSDEDIEELHNETI